MKNLLKREQHFMVKTSYQVLREMIFHSPLALTSLTDNHLIKVANSYLPYSTGIEVECAWLNPNIMEYTDISPRCIIPNLMQSNHDNCEKRFRIPSGIKGMICLYNISEWLKENCGLNEQSGIHYHIDTGNYISDFIHFDIKGHHWMLDSLDSWGYKGHYNSRAISNTKTTWVALRQTKGTLEFRLGEMTFEYDLLIKRIIHCQNLTRKFKQENKNLFSHIKPKEFPIWDTRAW
jgi:hypothetical protein